MNAANGIDYKIADIIKSLTEVKMNVQNNQGLAKIKIINVTSENVAEAGICCNKNMKSPGFIAKSNWFKSEFNQGLIIKLAMDDKGHQVGFIEFIPSENAWRPLSARHFLFIQCIAVYAKGLRKVGLGSLLIKECEEMALKLNMNGVCTITSEGVWMSGKKLFERNGYRSVETKDRFELLVKKFKDVADPVFNNWEINLSKYLGWNLIYANQCPWHFKSVSDLTRVAKEFGITLKVCELKTPLEAQNSPTGFGTFALVKDGRILADHYISETRFRNIISNR